MAITVKLNSFTINGLESLFVNSGNNYNTYNVLNGGETYFNNKSNELIYKFSIKGLSEHIAKYISFNCMLLTENGEINIPQQFKLLSGNLTQTIILNISESQKEFPVKFAYNTTFKDDDEITLVVNNNSLKSSYFCLSNILIMLSDINNIIQITFTGGKTNRSASSITCATLNLNTDNTSVSFEKDLTQNFKNSSVEGRIYFNKNGIFVDNYQVGTGVLATSINNGLVKIRDSFDIDNKGILIAPNNTGVAASDILVYNTMLNLKEYTDNKLKGVQAPINIENNEEIKSLQEGFTFSDDFIYDNNKIYLNWKEL